MGRSELVGHHAVWWRSDVRQDKNILTPIPPFEPYDPFDWYWPQGGGTREERSLPYQFLDVDVAAPASVHQFSQRFGVLGNPKNEGWAYKPAEISSKKSAETFLRGA